MGSLFSPLSNAVMGLPISKWLLEKATGIDKRRSMPRFARGSFLTVGGRYLANEGPVSEPVDKVAYFVDTYANFNDHVLGFTVLDVLRHNGIEVILPPQRPAPLPAIVYGDVLLAKRDLAYSVAHLARAVREGYKIVCSEPSAALCLKEELRHYVSGEDARLVAENTYELMNYLADLRRQGKLQPPVEPIEEKFVYHLPCHLCAVGDETVTLRLLQEHFKVDVADLQAGCCGLSGTFGMQQKNYELSSQISESLAAALKKAPTQSVLTECAACKMQIEHIAAAKATHPIEVIASGYRL
jgi:Fe-S oxidoreductase